MTSGPTRWSDMDDDTFLAALIEEHGKAIGEVVIRYLNGELDHIPHRQPNELH